MKRIIIVAAFASAIALTGCAKDKISAAEGTLLGCDAYASALDQLAGLREQGKIGGGTVQVVDHVRDTLNPLCLGPAPDVDASVKDVAIDAGVRTLQSILVSVF